jgi:SAM-dependent methyltransferase
MPSCAECKWLVGKRCSAYELAQAELKRPLPPPPSGACMIPIVEGYLAAIGSGARVLEIGCGAWTKIRAHCERVGARYEGIDTQAEYFGVKSAATRIENLASLSFADDSFDLVIGNQTMEHWAEYGCATEWGLYQCFRACKPGGKVLLNIPIHFHGTRNFLLGELGRIRRKFEPFSSQVTFEKWGSPCAPLPPLFVHPDYLLLRGKPAYVIDIQAVKDKPLPRGYSNRWGMSGRVSQLFNYPFTYNVHRAVKKLSGLWRSE